MFLGQTIKMCFKNVLSNRLRSLLTMLGIIIGISSVIILVGFAQGTWRRPLARSKLLHEKEDPS
jgi:putative ABC transport system permease protein